MAALQFLDKLFAYSHCKRFHQVQELGYPSNGQENEELGKVKCSKGMSGTESLFPELSSAGKCEVVQSLRDVPRRSSANGAQRGKSLGGPPVLLKASHRRGHNNDQFQNTSQALRLGQLQSRSVLASSDVWGKGGETQLVS